MTCFAKWRMFCVANGAPGQPAAEEVSLIQEGNLSSELLWLTLLWCAGHPGPSAGPVQAGEHGST